MNVVFNKKSLRVVSIFDSDCHKDPEEFLKAMFSDSFEKFGFWKINKKFSHNPIHLTVALDNENNPDVLFYKDKEIFRSSKEEKERLKKKKIEDGRKFLSKILPKSLRFSLGSDIVKMWINSPYTSPYIAKDLLSLDYFSNEKIMPVSWWGTFINAGGYANMNRSIVFRLHNHYIIPRTEVVPTISQISQTGQFYVSKYSSFNFRRLKKYSHIYGFGPQPHNPHKGRTIFYTMMETETLHPEFRNLCNMYSDEIWVPSKHNKKLFERSGVTKPIHLMPLGIDETIYRKEKKDLGHIAHPERFSNIIGKPVSEGINAFRFITLFGWSFRKGIDVLIKSFVRAFSDKDDVTLLIASTHVGPDIVRADTKKYAREVRGGRYPQILFYPHVTPEREMPSIYRMGHAFIHVSRGEGFSLPQIEASACGLPVISCNHTGMSEYLREDNSFVIKTRKKEPCKQEMHWISHYYHGQLFPKLGETQISQSIDHMHSVINDYKNALKMGQVLQKEVFQKYTWEKATKRVAKRIREISQ